MSWFKPTLSVMQKISLARLMVKKVLPFFTFAVYRLIPIECSTVKTIAVTKRAVLYYNSEYIKAQPLEQVAAALVHELGHLLRHHHDRAETLGVPARLHVLANLCMDAELNDGHTALLPLAQAVLPEHLNPPQPPHKLWEFYYKACKDHPQRQQPKLGHGECGSCAGHPAPGEPVDGRGRSDAEMHTMRQQVAQAIVKHHGSVPGSWNVWAQEQLKPPQIRWQDKLPRLIRTVHQYTLGHTDAVYDRPNRRQTALGFGVGKPVLPRLVSPLPEIMFIDDTSGSMNQQEHVLVVSEAAAILKSIGLPLTFGACDAKMQTLQRVTKIEDALKLLKGGGGTDFNPIFAALKNTKPKPNILIIGTDGWGPAPLRAPLGVETIWLLIGKNARKPVHEKKEITWGHFLQIQ